MKSEATNPEHLSAADDSGAKGSKASIASVALAGSFLAVGTLLLAFATTWTGLPALLLAGGYSGPWIWPAMLVLGGCVLFALGVRRMRTAITELEDVEERPEPKRSAVLYGRHLVGIGIALLVDATFTIMVFAGLARVVAGMDMPAKTPAGGELGGAAAAGTAGEAARGALGRFEDLFGGKDEAEFVAVMLLLSTCVALLGALFFFATSIWQKMEEPQREPFDRSHFWAGLWYRLGEAIVFNLVLFLVLRAYLPDQFLLLPLTALLVGMFLKAGEQLISGLANRIFAAFSELLPSKPVRRAVLKMLTLVPHGSVFGSDSALSKAGEKLVESLEAMKGVTRVFPDPSAEVLRVEFDALLTDSDRVKHELRVHGLEPRMQE